MSGAYLSRCLGVLGTGLRAERRPPAAGQSAICNLQSAIPFVGAARILRSVLTAAVLLAAAAPESQAQPGARLPVRLRGASDNAACFGCHGHRAWAERNDSAGARHTLYVDPKEYKSSIHSTRACTECHDDVTSIPHGKIAPVRCGRCHPQGDMPLAVPRGTAAQHESVHARALRVGKKDAPGCADCHGSHAITGPAKDGSRVNRANVPATCGKCHLEEFSQYRHSIHGEAVAAGKTDAAVCTDCHGEHNGILPKDNPESSIHPLKVPDTCSRCHESAALRKRHGLPAARYATYRESYHGIVAKYGDTSAANCASCHGVHDILPSSNPDSRVNRAHLATTCGECHPGATENFARGSVHLLPTPKQDAPLFWARYFYRGFIFALMAQFVGMIALDLLARRREKRRGGHSA